MDSVIKAFASGLGLGYMPYAPGTFGTILGVLLFIALSFLSPLHYAVSSVAFFFMSSYISTRAEIIYKKKDSCIIVIDEVMGFLVTMAFIKPSLYSVLLGFIYFRFFDITKIWPSNVFNRMSGGYAVVMDDVIAGIYANILLRLTMAIFPGI